MRPSSKLAAFFMVACCAATLADDEGTSAKPKLPQLVMPKGQDWYGAIAKRAGLEGRVLVAFNIAADGHLTKVSVIWAEDSVLEADTLQLLKSIRFKVPTDWGTADVWRRWRLGFVYRLCPWSGQSREFAIPVETVVITGWRLTGAPVRTAPATKQSESCVQSR